jgi:hypothetical protein
MASERAKWPIRLAVNLISWSASRAFQISSPVYDVRAFI